MQVQYLTGERLYLRALRLEDTGYAAAWFHSPYPINSSRAEKYLKEQHATNPWNSQNHHLAICRRDNDEIIGSVRIRFRTWSGYLDFHMAPWLEDADDLRAETLRVVVPWLLDEHELLLVTVPLPADQTSTILAAQQTGMTEVVRLRRFFARPGSRVDLVRYQAINANRPEVKHA